MNLEEIIKKTEDFTGLTLKLVETSQYAQFQFKTFEMLTQTNFSVAYISFLSGGGYQWSYFGSRLDLGNLFDPELNQE